MKVTRGKIFVLLFGLLCSNLFAQGNNQAVLDFNVQGIKLGCPLKEFLNTNKFSSEYSASNSQTDIGKKVYTSGNIPNMSYCVFRFFNDKLYSVKIIYEDKVANKMGGYPAILNKLVERFGQKFDAPDEMSKDKNAIFEGSMDFPKVNRYLIAGVYQDYMYITIIDTKLEDEMQNKKESNMNLGF